MFLLGLLSLFNYNHFSTTLDGTEGEAEAGTGGDVDGGLKGRHPSSWRHAEGDTQSPTLGAACLVRLI